MFKSINITPSTVRWGIWFDFTCKFYANGCTHCSGGLSVAQSAATRTANYHQSMGHYNPQWLVPCFFGLSRVSTTAALPASVWVQINFPFLLHHRLCFMDMLHGLAERTATAQPRMCTSLYGVSFKFITRQMLGSICSLMIYTFAQVRVCVPGAVAPSYLLAAGIFVILIASHPISRFMPCLATLSSTKA